MSHCSQPSFFLSLSSINSTTSLSSMALDSKENFRFENVSNFDKYFSDEAVVLAERLHSIETCYQIERNKSFRIHLKI